MGAILAVAKLNMKERKREQNTKCWVVKYIKERCNAYLYRVHHRARPRSHLRNYHRHSHSHLRFMKHMVQWSQYPHVPSRFQCITSKKKKIINIAMHQKNQFEDSEILV